MNRKFNPVSVFALGICISSCLLSNNILDFTLTPRFIVLSVTLLVAVSLLFLQNIKIVAKIDKVILSYTLYILFCATSILWAENTAEAFFEISKQCLAFFVFLLSYYFLAHNPKALWNVLNKFCIIIVFIGLAAALYQFIGIKIQSKDSIYAITGLNSHKNLYASFLFLNLFFLMRTYLTSNKFFKLLSAFAIVTSLLLLVFLRTKAVFLGLGVTFIIGVILSVYMKIKFNAKLKIKPGVIFIFGMIIINIFFLIVLKPIIDKGIKYNSEINSDKTQVKPELDNERLLLWQKSIEMFKKHPIAGVGAGNWQIFLPDETLSGLWRAEDLNYTFQRPHNDFLWILCEYGIIGFNLFFAFLFLLLISVVKILKNERATEKPEMILCVAIIIGYFIISFFDFPKERMEHLIWINLIFAVSYYNIKKNAELKTMFSFELKRPVLISVLGVLFFIITIGVLRYKGEFFTRKMYDAKNNTIYSEVIRLGAKAQSFAYSLDPTSVPIAWYIGNANAALKKFDAARKEFEKAYVLNPYNRNVTNDLASADVMSNQNEQAIKLYIETARISPRFDEAKLNLTAIYIQQKRYKEALDCLNSISHDSDRRTNYKKMVEVMITQEKRND